MAIKKPSKTVLDLSSRIKGTLSVKDDQVIAPPSLYEDMLPESLTMETVNAVHDHRNAFNAACHLAAGELMTSTMQKDEKMQQMTFEVPVGKDISAFSTSRGKDGLSYVGSYIASDHNRDIETVSAQLRANAKSVASA